ncbi:MAG: hypothetical protein MUC59_16055, partial [Saprospiraceae bacterium]|nr:hypothetical protein [Saprospiraceae bacterium]
MKNLLHLLTLFACAMATPIAAQVELKIQLGADGSTYTAFARSQADLLPPMSNITHLAQIVVTVPTGAFELEALTSHGGQWQLANLVQHPAENPSLDYALFMLTAPTDAFSYPAGQDVPLFSFKNKLGCTGRLDIMHPTADPFLPPNSLGLPVRHSLIIEGAGPGNAVIGRYEAGAADCFRSANCLVTCELELMPDHFYQVSLKTDPSFSAPGPLTSAQVSLRVPTNFFQVHDLTNLLPGQFSFSNTSRQDSPAEDDGHDYITFRMNATGAGLDLQPGTKTPILRFANGGSCQGDSIFLVKNDAPFLPPNSQAASLGHSVRFANSPENQPICPGAMAAAPCIGCQFTAGLVKLDSAQTANPVACLGGSNGMIRLFAHGAPNLAFSIDGGQNWSDSGYFTGLTTGTYQPMVRGTKFGCLATAIGQALTLENGTTIDLQIEAPAAACAGEDVAFKIMSPNPLPANASFAWSGPQGFSPSFANPVVFNVNNYQSGIYTLTLDAPGCQTATASAAVQVSPLPAIPDFLT